MNDDGVTALNATLALLLGDRPLTSSSKLTSPGSPPAHNQVNEVESAPRTVGRLIVTRADRAVVNDLLNDSPLPPPAIYFDAAGQIQTPGDSDAGCLQVI